MARNVSGKFISEPARKTPIARETDVLVVGGGMAGSCASIAAGRMGLKTILVEYFGYLGGNATNSSINAFCGFYTFQRNAVQLVKGIGGMIVQILTERNGARLGELGDIAFDPEMLKLVLDEKMIEANVEPLYYTQMVAPIVEKDTIKGVIVENKGGARQFWGGSSSIVPEMAMYALLRTFLLNWETEREVSRPAIWVSALPTWMAISSTMSRSLPA